MPSDLTPIQDQVLALISAGFSATVAARHAGVHRHSVANWLQTEPFRAALEAARDRKRLLYLDHAENLAASATGNLARMAEDPDVPPAVRLKASIAMLEHARLFLNLKSGMAFPEVSRPEPVSESMAKNVQSAPVSADEIKSQQSQTPQQGPQPVAQAAETSTEPQLHTPKIGRNELCPCGSGIKFKRCCIGKAASPVEVAAAA